MKQIIIGTTPTIVYTFRTVPVSTITTAFFTVKRGGVEIIKKPLSEAVVGENTISWTLSQEDTLAIGVRLVTMMINWVTADDVRGASKEETVNGVNNHIREVIV